MPTPALATTLVPALNGLRAHAPTDNRLLYNDNSPEASIASAPSGFRADFVARMQVEYPIMDDRRVPRIKSLQITPSVDRTPAAQLGELHA